MKRRISERFLRPEYVYQPNKLIRRIFSKGSEFLCPREEPQA